MAILLAVKRTAYFLIVFHLWLFPDIAFAQIDSANSRPAIIHKIIITGNKVTKQHIITRELIFHDGDTIPAVILDNAIARSQENLMNIGLFNFVEITKYKDESNQTDIHINVTERWYIWPFPFFEVVDRNFNEWWLTKDFSRTNYGIYLVHENFRGRDESLKIQLRMGYSQRFGLYYNIPYINKAQNLGISFGGYFTRNHEINYATEGNKLRFYKDPNNFVRKDETGYTRLTYRTGIYDYYSGTVEYRNISTVDTVVKRNINYLVEGSSVQQQISLAWSYRHDQRDYQAYALKGHLFEIEVANIGLGILKNEPDLLTITFAYRKYKEWNPRWHSSFALSGKVSGMNYAPYVNLRALGYGNDVVRGYEYYVINGNNFFLVKANLIRYTLLKTFVYNLSFIRSEKFNRVPNTMYLTLSSDAGYVRDRQFSLNNPLSNSWCVGYGAGIDYVTFYDLVFRFEYSFNILGESGFFVNFAAPF